MRFLGIDYGTKRVGFALSDEGGTLGRPLGVVKNNSELYFKIRDLIAKFKIDGIVVGESLDRNGLPNLIMKELEYFLASIARRYKLPVHMEKESFSSFEAHGREGKEVNNARKGKIKKTTELDAKAAAIILQRFLDKRNKK